MCIYLCVQIGPVGMPDFRVFVPRIRRRREGLPSSQKTSSSRRCRWPHIPNKRVENRDETLSRGTYIFVVRDYVASRGRSARLLPYLGTTREGYLRGLRPTYFDIHSDRPVAVHRPSVPSSPPSLPPPAAILVLRFAHTIGDGSSSYEQVHDYVASELDRLVRVEAGAVVLNGIADLLIVAKARLLRTDGLLPVADLISNNLHRLPGLGR